MPDLLTALVERGARPDHVGLAYDVWAPMQPGTGKVPDDRRAAWLQQLCGIPISPDYAASFARWRSWVERHCAWKVVELPCDLLIGHGNPSPTEVGLTVHRTWGVPIIPGSALKGLLNHYVEAVYGPADAEEGVAPQLQKDAARAAFLGPTYDPDGGRPLFGPGEVHRHLFGAPSTKADEALREAGFDVGETGGALSMMDALYVPTADNASPYRIGVITVHQMKYYAGTDNSAPATDYDDPTPVQFLCVRRGARFLVAVQERGLDEPPAKSWAGFALGRLVEAISEWGAGGKTSSGYGHGTPEKLKNTADIAGLMGEAPANRGTAPKPKAPEPPKVEIIGPVEADLFYDRGSGILEAVGKDRVRLGVLPGGKSATLIASLPPDLATRLKNKGRLSGVRVTIRISAALKEIASVEPL